MLLSSAIRDDNEVLTVDLINPLLTLDEEHVIPQGRFHILRSKFIKDDICYESLSLECFDAYPKQLDLTFSLLSDFKDIFEIRGVKRDHRGKMLKTKARDGVITFGYMGLDGTLRQSVIQSNPKPSKMNGSEMCFNAKLKAKSDTNIYIDIKCLSDGVKRRVFSYDKALVRAQNYLRIPQGSECEIETSNQRFNDWLYRSRADLKQSDGCSAQHRI